jgi:hypothetical protein
MSRLANISCKDAMKAFEKAGWNTAGRIGNYIVLTRPGINVNISIPQHKELSMRKIRSFFFI